MSKNKPARKDRTAEEWRASRQNIARRPVERRAGAVAAPRAAAMPPITEPQLREVMKFHLTNFNDEGVAINDATIHNTVLSDHDGFGTSNSKNIYQAAVHLTLIKRGHPNAIWPSDWMDQDVATVAAVLIA